MFYISNGNGSRLILNVFCIRFIRKSFHERIARIKYRKKIYLIIHCKIFSFQSIDITISNTNFNFNWWCFMRYFKKVDHLVDNDCISIYIQFILHTISWHSNQAILLQSTSVYNLTKTKSMTWWSVVFIRQYIMRAAVYRQSSGQIKVVLL